jgi:hypothetical protein
VAVSANTVDRKVAAGVAVGGVVSVLAWAIETFTTVKLSADAAIGLTAALTFIVQYFVPNKAVEDSNDQTG